MAAAIALLARPGFSAEPSGLPPKEKFHLFLLIGQSNMAGRGAVEEPDRTPHARVLVLTQAGAWAPAVDPLHFDKPVAGTGLGKTFGICVAEAKLHDLVARLRKELDAPEVPFLVGQLGQFADQPWDQARRRVDQAHRDLPAKVPHTAFVSSSGLRHKGDKVHFDSASYREFGKRYADAYTKLVQSSR
jgi:hypothetical protein